MSIKEENISSLRPVNGLRRHSCQIPQTTSIKVGDRNPASSNNRHVLRVQVLIVDGRHAVQVVLRIAVRRPGLKIRADRAESVVADHDVFGSFGVREGHTHDGAAGLVDVVGRWNGAESWWAVEAMAVPELAERDL